MIQEGIKIFVQRIPVDWIYILGIPEDFELAERRMLLHGHPC